MTAQTIMDNEKYRWIQVTDSVDQTRLRQFSAHQIESDRTRIFHCQCGAFYVGNVPMHYRQLLRDLEPTPPPVPRIVAHVCYCGTRLPVPNGTVLVGGGRHEP